MHYKNNIGAYITGIAIGDGNLSNPNGRATRLRITCDNKYPEILKNISKCLENLFPENKISIYHRDVSNCSDVCVYSNKLEDFLGWKALGGSKFSQNVRVPTWVFHDKEWMRACLRGLIETDGSIYVDRGYRFINFTTIMHGLSQDVQIMLALLGYRSSTQIVMQTSGKWKFVTRIASESDRFINELNINKT